MESNNTKRDERREVALETVEVLQKGVYDFANVKVIIKDNVEASVRKTEVKDWTDFKKDWYQSDRKAFHTSVEVSKEDSVSCIRRLDDEGVKNLLVLNFASAKKPGGGFLNGSLAQEECLAYCSGLYATLEPQKEYYGLYHKHESGYYTDSMIYSPDVPFFRDKYYNFLPMPVSCSVITSPAVNVSALSHLDEGESPKIEEVMDLRIQKMLSLCIEKGHTNLILGAWGCGVFGNNPRVIARLFKKHITETFSGCFEKVVFAVYSSDPSYYNTFQSILDDE